MHCPYCNADLLGGRELKCSATGALFSQVVSDAFRNRYGQDRTVSSSPGTARSVTIGNWFCPGCGVPMQEHRCLTCGQEFDRQLLRSIIELNPHKVP